MATADKINGASRLASDGSGDSKAKTPGKKPKQKKPRKAASKGKATSGAPSPVPKHKASIFSWPQSLPAEFVDNVRELERLLDQEVWLLSQGGPHGGPFNRIDFSLLERFTSGKAELPKPVKVNGSFRSRLAVLIHSPGGYAEPAYRLARLLQRRCGGFTAIVPRSAMSAATLLSLGANSILLGEDAELGPLDAQFFDFDVAEDWVSALDEVQAVEALEQSATDTAYKVMIFLKERTAKSLNVLMPHALRFAAEITKPLFEKIDAVRYSRQSRRLQEAQDYAERLLRPRYTEEQAKAIAQDLVRKYPTHEFVIDRQEAKQVGKLDDQPPVGLRLNPVNHEVEKLLDWFYANLGEVRAIGRLTAM